MKNLLMSSVARSAISSVAMPKSEYAKMSYVNENLQTFMAATDDLAATGDATSVFRVATPITVYEVGTYADTAIVGTTGVLKFDISTPNGASFSRGDGDCGVVQIVANANIGRVIKKVLNPPVDLKPGDKVTPEITTAVGTSGTGFHFINYRQREEVSGNLPAVVLSA